METNYLRRKPRPMFGFAVGILTGVLYSLFAAVRYLFQGAALFERIGVPFETVIGYYLVAGAVGGTLVGVLWPLTVRPLGAALVGMVGAFPLYHGAGILLGQGTWRDSVVLAVLAGGIGGLMYWKPVKSPSDKDKK